MIRDPIKICYFPGRESTYARNRVLIKGMREAGLTVFDCSYPKKKLIRYLLAFIKFLRYKNTCDLIFIGFFGQFLVPLVRVFTDKKIIFDAFVCAYQTLAFDRKSISPNGPAAKIIQHIEKKSCLIADKVFLDTQQHIDYFANTYHIDRNKFQRSFPGSDYSLSELKNAHPSDEFMVQFHGEFQSLHGTKYILQAAKLLPHIKFRMIGRGRDLEECLKLAKDLKLSNVIFLPPVAFDELSRYIIEASICLGIFGKSQKTQLVIPIKVYESLALAKPIITSDTPAVRELLTHRKDVYLCRAADPEDLAKAVETLKNDESLRNEIAHNGYETYQSTCSPRILGGQIRELAHQLLNAN